MAVWARSCWCSSEKEHGELKVGASLAFPQWRISQVTSNPATLTVKINQHNISPLITLNCFVILIMSNEQYYSDCGNTTISFILPSQNNTFENNTQNSCCHIIGEFCVFERPPYISPQHLHLLTLLSTMSEGSSVSASFPKFVMYLSDHLLIYLMIIFMIILIDGKWYSWTKTCDLLASASWVLEL